MPTKFSLPLLFLILVGCAKLNKNDREDDSPTSTACLERKSQIEASISKLNYCESASDCTYAYVNSHWGCSILFNKAESSKEVEASIDSYSESSCWDGMTTLKMLDCVSISEEDLDCVEKKCTYVP